MTAPLSHPISDNPPPLEQGDRLTRDEFERRYDAMPQVKKAELIEGVVYTPSPVRIRRKLEAYRRNGVREYIVWRVLDQEIDWFVLRGDQFEKLSPDADGLLKSEVFPGLWLDAVALLQGDLARVLAVVQQGTASPEHAAFVARLKADRSNNSK